jgi:hypothetical protein
VLKINVKIQLVIFAIIGLIIFNGESDAYATVDCISAQVVFAGPAFAGTSKVGVLLKNTSPAAIGTWAVNTDRMFYLHDSILDRGLATLLTAKAIQRNVWVRLVNYTAGSLITIVYVK